MAKLKSEIKSVEMKADMAEPVTVLVTGFGPFSIYECNASWEAVQELHRIGLDKDIRLVVERIPVEYKYVLEEVQNMWNKHSPSLVVHCGVSGMAEELTLEQEAHNTGYMSCDVNGSLPDSSCCIMNAPEVLKSGIEMKNVCSEVNGKCDVKTIVSHDPGRYLCDFIYYTSLNINSRRTAFIHVPPLDKPYSAEQLAQAIRLAIMAMLDQLADVRSVTRENEVES